MAPPADVALPRVRTLRPGLHLLETEVEGFDVRAAVVVGNEAAVMFDTLDHPRRMAGVVELVGGRPCTVVYSHADWDHAWGTCGLTAFREVVAHTAAAERFEDDVPTELSRRTAEDRERWDGLELVAPTRVFDGVLALPLGGVTLELHALPGHTPDCLVGWLPEWGILLAGDTVETPLPVVNDGAAVPGWIQGLESWLLREDVALVVPSHGRVGGLELVANTRDYLQALSAPGGPRVPGELAPFYAETHGANLRAMVERRSANGGS